MTLYGWDASDFDWDRGPMDLGAAYRDGIRFFTHKATEGTRVIHRHYGEALNRARAAGIEFLGAYVVPRTPGNNGHGSVQAQVDFFLKYLDAHTPWWRTFPGFMLQVDSEHWGYDNVSGATGAAMCAELGRRVGTFRIHYAPKWSYGDSIPGPDPLWASNYGGNPVAHYLEAYRRGGGDNHPGWGKYSGRTPTVLQYGSKTRIGSQSTCDANAFRGSIEEFRAMVTGETEMTLGNDPDGVYLIWRADAMANLSPTIQGGPQKGQAVPFVRDFKALQERVAAIQPGAMTPEQIANLKTELLTELKAGLPTAADIVNALVERKPTA